MDNYEFNPIQLKEQAQHTWVHGVYLASQEIRFIFSLLVLPIQNKGVLKHAANYPKRCNHRMRSV